MKAYLYGHEDMSDPQRSPLMKACIFGHKDVIKFLQRQKNIDSNGRAKHGWTPCMNTCNNGHRHVIQLLFGRKNTNWNDKDKSGRTLVTLKFIWTSYSH